MQTTTERHPGLSVQLAIHRAVRRDLDRLSRALEAGPPASSEAVRAYWADFADKLHHHHELEDEVIWPLLGTRLDGRVDDLLAENAAQHAAMRAAMDELDEVLATTADDRSSARAALAVATERIVSHLADEEADVLPLVAEVITQDDVAFFMAESAKVDPPPVFLPWVLDDAADEDAEFFAGVLPPPVREQLESSWLPARRMRLDSPELTGRAGVVAALEDACQQAIGVVGRIGSEQLGQPSRCAGWDARGTLNHLLGTMRMFTLVNEGEQAGEDAGDVVGSDAPAALRAEVERNVAAWRSPYAFEGERTFPFGTFPAAAAALMNLSEVVVHTWDLAPAAGCEVVIDPVAAAMLVDFYSAIPLDPYREHGAFGPEVAVAADAPAAERLLGILGREPA
jgi:uncharacterized protein (TIGR03086 family)